MTASATTQNNPHGQGHYLPALDGWRAVAILLVLLFHGLFNSDLGNRHWLVRLEEISARTGAMGVLIFFAISGYIITSRLYAESGGQRISLRVFYTKRAFRILPPMVVYLLVLVMLFLVHAITLERADWFAPVFLNNYFPASDFTRHFWSLSVEEHFYFFWPLCIVLAGWRRALWVGVGIVAAVAVWRPWELARLTVGPSDPAYAVMHGDLLAHTDMRMDYIMMGCILALALTFYPWATRLLQAAGSGFGLLVLLVLMLVSTHSFVVDTRSIQAVLIAVAVVGSVKTKSWFSTRVLGNRYMLFLGKLSYSLYLWQQLFLVRSDYAWLRSPLALPLKFAVALGAAYLSYRFVERPMIRRGQVLIARWREADMAKASLLEVGQSLRG
jgi:peptidoglycan/LPS O-acetylase OafA/YrhL